MGNQVEMWGFSSNGWFDQFWASYPRKISKKTAREKFLRAVTNEKVFTKVMEALELHKKQEQWKRKEFIPHPSTWIHQERWEDEIEDDSWQARARKLVLVK